MRKPAIRVLSALCALLVCLPACASATAAPKPKGPVALRELVLTSEGDAALPAEDAALPADGASGVTALPVIPDGSASPTAAPTPTKPAQTQSALRVGETLQLRLAYLPENTTQRSVTYSSSRTRVASVDRNGFVTALGEGVTLIRVTSMHNDRIWASYRVEVMQYPESVAFAKVPETLAVGEFGQVSVTVLPRGVHSKAVLFSTSDEAIATVDAKGRLRGVAPGVVTLTAACAMDEAIRASVEIRVVRRAQSVVFEPARGSLAVGETLSLNAVFAPSDTTDQRLSYRSSNARVAAVDENGVVTGVAAGQATISAATLDGSKKVARFSVRVVKAVQDGK